MKFIKKQKYFLLMLMVIALGCVAFVLPSYMDGNYFVGGGDVRTQWFPFYILNRRVTINAVKSHTFPFYSFVLFLGNNIWASKSSYGLFDIYNILSYAIDRDFFYVYDLLCILKIFVAGISMYLLINNIYKNKKISMFAGIAYALSSYALYFTSQPGFLSFYSLAPLYLLGIEHYLHAKKRILFIIMVFFLLLTNYYFFYTLTIFTPIYFIYRFLNINKKPKGLIKSALKLICFYLIGVLLSAFVIAPAFFYIIQNQRVGSVKGSVLFKYISLYFHLLISMFVPSHTYIYSQNIFELGEHTLKEVCLYCGSLIALLVPQFLSDKDSLFKKTTSVLYVVMLLFMFIPNLSSALNGFSEPCFRWLYIFMIFNIIVAAKYLTSSIDKKTLSISTLIIIILIIISYLTTFIINANTIDKTINQIISFGIILINLLTIAYLILKNKTNFYLSVAVIELCVFAAFFGYKIRVTGINDKYIDRLTSVVADNNDYHNLKCYLDGLEENNVSEYYRVYIDYDSLYWSFSHDMSLIYNINDLMSYDSTYAPSTDKLKGLNYAGVVDYLDWEYKITDKNIINFLSTKYSITTTLEQIPFYNYAVLDDAYRGSFIIAKNLNYKPFGRTYVKSMSYEELYKKYNNDTKLLNEYVISDEDIKLHANKKYTMEQVSYYNNHISGYVDTEENTFLVLSLPYDNGWKIMVNGKQIDYIECNGGMIGFYLESGVNSIEMYFIPKGFKIGCLLSATGALLFAGVVIMDIVSRGKKYGKEH